MYQIKAEADSVRQIQEYLLELSHVSETIPHVTVDGIYGKETAESVRAFQESVGLAATGEVDALTFSLLYEEYTAARDRRQAQSDLFPASVFPMKMGDNGSFIRILQTTLDALLGTHLKQDGFFGAATEESVRALQRRYLLPPSGTVDLQLWNRIAAGYKEQIEGIFFT